MQPLKLSHTTTGQNWLAQFSEQDRAAAAAMLDALLLLNEEQVAAAIRGLLQSVARERKGRRKRVGLYAEREFPEPRAFEVALVQDHCGVLRRRATGRSGPVALRQRRGSPRIGSEGFIAFIISQAVEAWPHVYANQPGPDRFRARSPIGAIAIVTDIVGSGTRVRTILDKFWAVPTIRAWMSRRWVKFLVVAAAGTPEGIKSVSSHRVKPPVLVEKIVPTLSSAGDAEMQSRWRALIRSYGPRDASQEAQEGFLATGALVAFSYRIPNNTPALLHRSGGGWRALYTGHAPEDLRSIFRLEARAHRIQQAARSIGVDLAADLSEDHAQTVLVLSAVRGRWRQGAEVSIAEMTGLTVPEVIVIRRRAIRSGLLSVDGRLTDVGQATLQAGARSQRKRPDIPTASEPYYPKSLRVPRG